MPRGSKEEQRVPTSFYLCTNIILSVYQHHFICVPTSFYLCTNIILSVYQHHFICVPTSFYL
ncbi:hypothetical protein, partial [Enterococcus faecalis]|uniref:hypothetical protein n=1 Tax=Enterococcus faecalis TaxID=1351 RepID=UPI00352E2DE6